MRTLVVAAVAMLTALTLVPRPAGAQGEPIGSEFRVNTYTTDQQLMASLAGDGSGNFVVVWTSGLLPASETEILGQRYAASGTPVGPEFRINTYTPGLQWKADVASAPAGDFVVVWASVQPIDEEVFGQRYDPTGSPVGPQFQVNTYTPGSQSDSRVAMDAAGGFVVVWRGPDGGGYGGVFGQRYANSGVPLGPEFRINTYTTGTQRELSLAVDPAGDFIVVWESQGQDGDAYAVFGQRFASTGTPLGPEFRVNTYTTGDQVGPSVAVADSGAFVVVWSSPQDGSSHGVLARLYDTSGAPVGSEFRVNTYTTDGQFLADVTADSAGNFVVAWTSNFQLGGGYSDVFGQRFSSTGAPFGPEFRVNTYTTGFQDSPAVASVTGNFVVVWGGRQSLFTEDVFGQRFGQIVPVGLTHFQVD